MKASNYWAVIILITLITSCSEKRTNEPINVDRVKPISEDSINAQKQPVHSETFSDTLRINKNTDRKILNALALIPSNAMSSWDWAVEDRRIMVDEALENGYTVDTDHQYRNIVSLESNYLSIQVIDGVWVMSIYIIDAENTLIITDDIVGDGDELHAYKLSEDKIEEIALSDVLPDVYEYFLKDIHNKACAELLEPEFTLTLDYDFSNKDEISIYSSYPKNKETEQCLNGNTLVMKFDKHTEKFNPLPIIWSKDK